MACVSTTRQLEVSITSSKEVNFRITYLLAASVARVVQIGSVLSRLITGLVSLPVVTVKNKGASKSN